MAITIGDAILFLRGDDKRLDADLGKAEKKTKSWVNRLGGKVNHLLGSAIKAGAVAATGAVVGLGAALVKTTLDAAAVEGVSQTFDKLADSIGAASDALLVDLRKATRGMVSDVDLMASANLFMAMGLANSQEEAAQLAEVATQLGAAMGEDATVAMEDFALMLANQSIPRLDTFGISSGKVRERIKELMKETKGMTREEAFMKAVMEEAAITMEKVGEQGDTTRAAMDRIGATISNVKLAIGKAFLPILDVLTKSLGNLAEKYGPLVTKWAETAAGWLGEKLPVAIETLLPIFEAVQAFIQDNFLPVIQDLINYFMAVVEDGDYLNDFLGNLPPAIQPVVQAIGEIVAWLGEQLPVAIAFLMEHWEALKGALIAVGAVLAGAGIVAAIASIAGAIAALVNPVTLVIAAVALLGAAWAEDWGGIRTAVTAAYKEHIEPALRKLQTWLAVQVPKAMARLREFWENTLYPALLALWAFIRDKVIPIVAEWVGWLIENIPRAFGIVADFWNNTLYPALLALWAFIHDKVIPIVSDMVTWLAETLTAAYTTVKTYWENTLKPALEALWAFIRDYVVPLVQALVDVLLAIRDKGAEAVQGAWENILSPALSALRDFIRDHVSPRVDALTGVLRTLGGYVNETLGPILSRLKSEFLDRLSSAFDGLKNAVQWVIDKLHTLADAISNINLPSWLVPGSPTPFEEGLRGIADALREVQALSETAFGAPRFAAAGVGAAAAGGTQATVIVQGPLIEHLVVAPGGLRPEQAAAQVAEELGKLLRSR